MLGIAELFFHPECSLPSAPWSAHPWCIGMNPTRTAAHFARKVNLSPQNHTVSNFSLLNYKCSFSFLPCRAKLYKPWEINFSPASLRNNWQLKLICNFNVNSFYSKEKCEYLREKEMAFNVFFKIPVFKNSAVNVMNCYLGAPHFVPSDNLGYSVTFVCKVSFLSPHIWNYHSLQYFLKQGRIEMTLLRPTLQVVFDLLNLPSLCFVCVCRSEVR